MHKSVCPCLTHIGDFWTFFNTTCFSRDERFSHKSHPIPKSWSNFPHLHYTPKITNQLNFHYDDDINDMKYTIDWWWNFTLCTQTYAVFDTYISLSILNTNSYTTILCLFISYCVPRIEVQYGYVLVYSHHKWSNRRLPLAYQGPNW